MSNRKEYAAVLTIALGLLEGASKPRKDGEVRGVKEQAARRAAQVVRMELLSLLPDRSFADASIFKFSQDLDSTAHLFDSAVLETVADEDYTPSEHALVALRAVAQSEETFQNGASLAARSFFGMQGIVRDFLIVTNQLTQEPAKAPAPALAPTPSESWVARMHRALFAGR